MHPLVARIHPALRTSLFAFLVGRSAYWISRWLQGRDLATLTYGVGPWTTSSDVVDLANSHIPWGEGQFGTWAMLGLNELLIWLAALAIYKVVRREGMPQTADRAVWFWMCTPLIFLLTPGSNLVPGLALGVWALELAGAGHAVWAGLAMALAGVVAPQAVVLFPGVAAMAFKGSKDELKPWVATLLPTLVLASTVLYGVFLGDTPHHVFGAFGLRTGWRPETLMNAPWDIAQLLVALVLLVLWGLSLNKLPKTFAVVALPAIVAVGIAPAGLAALFPLLMAAPIWAHLSLFAQDPEIERPLMGAGLLALVLVSSL